MPRPLTLFHLDSERGLRGGERQLLYLAGHLRRRGHENVVVCRSGSALSEASKGQGLTVMHLPFLGEWDPVSAWLLAREAGRRPGAVLHAHTGHAAALACLAARLCDAPAVVHRRVDFRLRGPLSRRLKYDAADRVVAVSDSVRRVLVEDGVDRSRIDVVPDCLPVSDDDARAAGVPSPLRPPDEETRRRARASISASFGLDPEAPWVGNLAALVGHKDQATLLRSVPEVLRLHPRARVVLIGRGPLRGELETLSRTLGVERAVLFAGYVEDTRPWLDALDVYVQSSWGEGMGSVLLEAMACRLPIVATTAGGIPEVVEDGRTALLVPPRQPEALGRAIAGALEDRAASRRRAEAALEDLERFGLAPLGDRMIEIYGSL